MHKLEHIAEEIRKDFDTRTAARDKALARARQLTRACSQAIRAVHRDDTDGMNERLTEAQDALHRLNIGESVVEVHDRNGEAIRYRPSDVKALERYIVALEREVAGESPVHTLLFSTSKGI